MKIVYLCADRGIPIGGRKGGSVHADAIVGSLRERGHDVHVVAAAVAGDRTPGDQLTVLASPSLLDLIDDGSDPSIPRALTHVLSNVTTHDGVQAALGRHRPDVLLERLSPFGIAGSIAARQLGCPHVVEVNALLAEEGARYRKQALGEAASYLERSTLRHAALVLTVSRELAERGRDLGVAADRILVVPNGVDQSLFAPTGPAATDVPRNRTIVGFLGSLKPWHGIDVLLAAFVRVLSRTAVHLLIVGDGPCGRTVERFAHRNPGHVTWRRSVAHEDVPGYVRAMDIAVAPYPPIEPFYFSPLKVLEYMAAGRAVIASRIGQVSDFIRHGETGWLVAPGHPDALGAAIHQLAQDPALRRALGTRAAAEVGARHLWSHRAADIGAALQRVVDRPSSWHTTAVHA